MALTRLKNVFTSKTGRCLYVNPDDFDASDAFDNRGNSPNRPFKTIQRALIESARFSYRTGQYNDAFEAFTIVGASIPKFKHFLIKLIEWKFFVLTF